MIGGAPLANAGPICAFRPKESHSVSKQLSPEFLLVAACCRWPPSPGRDASIRVIAQGPIEWMRVLRIARRQRVEGLLHAGLASASIALPTDFRAELGVLARDIAAQSLASAAQAGRLQSLLHDAGIENMVLKGAAVEVLAYGALGLKRAWDIDLLVSPDEVERACEVLELAGYQLVEPVRLTRPQFLTWIDLVKECELVHRDSGQRVELHWRLVDGPVLLPNMSVSSPSQLVAITNGICLRTLARDELFSYLCVHGAMHGWSRLKWLADLAALLTHERPEAIEPLYRRSLGLGAGACSAQALLLCERLLGTALPPSLKDELMGRAVVRWLFQFALATMTGGGAEVEVRARPLAKTQILLAQFALGDGWRHAAAQIRYRSVSVHDRTHLPLPKALHFLYPVLRVPLWVSRRLRSG